MDSPKLVVVGASLGGSSALKYLVEGLPSEFPLPLVIVQHRGINPDASLAEILRSSTSLAVSEPDDKEALEPGHIYLAPADYHLLVEPGRFALSTEGPVNYSRPSIDVLFESAAEAYGAGVIGCILTGANRDGELGCVRIKERGGFIIVQDPQSAEDGTMPQAAIGTGSVDMVLALNEIADCLAELCRYWIGGTNAP